MTINNIIRNVAGSKHNRKAVVAGNGRYITVLGENGKEWRVCPASFCAWAARDPQKRRIVGFGGTVWAAIREAEGEVGKIKGEKK